MKVLFSRLVFLVLLLVGLVAASDNSQQENGVIVEEHFGVRGERVLGGGGGGGSGKDGKKKGKKGAKDKLDKSKPAKTGKTGKSGPPPAVKGSKPAPGGKKGAKKKKSVKSKDKLSKKGGKKGGGKKFPTTKVMSLHTANPPSKPVTKTQDP